MTVNRDSELFLKAAKAAEILKTIPGCVQVILCGSVARGEARPDSDIDLCLVTGGDVLLLRSYLHDEPYRTLLEIGPYHLYIMNRERLMPNKRGNPDEYPEAVKREGINL